MRTVINPENKHSWFLRYQKRLPTEGGCWVKCRIVRAFEKLKIMDVTNDIRANLSLSTVWFENKSVESWWTCNTPIESHQNEKDPKAVQVWNCTTDDDLKELIDITYTNKIHILFGSLSLKNSIVKYAWLETINYEIDDFLGSFLKNMWVKTKHAEKSYVCGDNSLILKAGITHFWDLEKDYLQRIMIGGGFWLTRMLSEVSSHEVS